MQALRFATLLACSFSGASGGPWQPAARAQSAGACDPLLPEARDHPNGYRLRQDRCEGIYAQDVAVGATLVVASFTRSIEGFEPAIGKSLRLSWLSPGKRECRLRAYSLRRRQYYRMDSIRPAGATTYNWPSDILAAQKLSRDDIGIVAWTASRVGETEREVYLPVSVGTAPTASGYRLVLLPAAELSEIYITVRPAAPGSPWKSVEKLAQGSYPAERAIPLRVPLPPAPGIYFADIAATFSSGGASTLRLWFYHSGP